MYVVFVRQRLKIVFYECLQRKIENSGPILGLNVATMSHQREYQTEGRSYKEIQTDSLELQSSVTAVDLGLDSE